MKQKKSKEQVINALARKMCAEVHGSTYKIDYNRRSITGKLFVDIYRREARIAYDYLKKVFTTPSK